MPEIISKTAWKASTSPSVSGFLSSRCLLSLSDSVPRAALGRGRFLAAPLPGAAARPGRGVDRSWETQTSMVLRQEPPAPSAQGGLRGPGSAPRRAGAPGDRRDRPRVPRGARPSPPLLRAGPSNAQRWRVQGTLSPPRPGQAPVSLSLPREACPRV